MPTPREQVAVPPMPQAFGQYDRRAEDNFRDILRLFFNRIIGRVNDDNRLDIQTDSTTARTLTASDENSLITFTNAGAITVTIENDTTEAFPIGYRCELVRTNTGNVTVAAGVLNPPDVVTINGTVVTASQWDVLTVTKTAADTYLSVLT